MKPGVTSALIVVNVLLAVLIAALWITPQGKLRGTHWEPPAAVRPDLGATPVVSASQDDIDIGRFVAILDRPLFSTTRRPAPVLAKGVEPGRPDPLDGLHLYGIFSGSEGSGILARVDGKTRRIKVSESIGEWSLKAIQGQQVIFARGAETRSVAMAQARQGAVAGAAPSSGAPLAPGYGGDPAFRRIPRAIRRIPGLSGPATAPPAPAPAAPQPPAAAAAPSVPTPAPPAARKPAAASSASSPFVIGGSR